MTTDQQIEQLKWAAVAMGKTPSEYDGVIYAGFGSREWNPFISHEDSDRMGAELEINITFDDDFVRADGWAVNFNCPVWKLEYFADHNGNKSQALLAARMAVAEQIGKMKGEK